MLSKIKPYSLCLLFSFVNTNGSMARDSECRTYRVNEQKSITLHSRSFVDEVICPDKSPNCPNRPFKIKNWGKYLRNIPEDAIGPPPINPRKEKRKTGRRLYSLGCNGYAIWKFTDNVIVDLKEQPDIIVFEKGTKAEATTVEISKDGINWIIVGKVQGQNSDIDIAGPKVKPFEQFRYIRLTDLGESSCGKFAGADIQAIATYAYSHTRIGGADIFFDSGKFILKPEGKAEIDGIFSDENATDQKLEIVGHTDSDNIKNNNQQLSENRANSVAEYIIGKNYIKREHVKTFGAGSLRPVASNSTREGKAKNRRVELTFIPLSPCQ